MCKYLKSSMSAVAATASIVALLTVSTLPADAQIALSGSNSNSSSSAKVKSTAQSYSSSSSGPSSSSSYSGGSTSQASGGTSNARSSSGSSNAQVYLDQRGRAVTQTSNQHRYSGSYEVRTAPAVQAPSMGSGHPCGLSGSIGISIIGGGASAGVSQVDEACLLAQMGQGQAALMMIATRDPAACVALRQVGSIPSSSICSQAERREADRVQRELDAMVSAPAFAAPAPAPAALASIADFVTCSRNESGQLVARKRGSGPFSDDEVAQYCRDQNIQMASMSFVDQSSAKSLADYVTCSRNDSGQLVARKARGTPFNDEQVAQFCRDQQ